MTEEKTTNASVVAICFQTSVLPETFRSGLIKIKTELKPAKLIFNLPAKKIVPNSKEIHTLYDIMDEIFPKESGTQLTSYGSETTIRQDPRTKEMAQELKHNSSRLVVIGDKPCLEFKVYGDTVKDFQKKVLHY